MGTSEGEDYMIFGQAKGLKPFYLLIRYQVRNAILPQMTALALSLGSIVSGQVLVEAVFSYRGLGTVILSAILNIDYTVIQGTSFILILVTAIAVLIIDLLYPMIDPRISLDEFKTDHWVNNHWFCCIRFFIRQICLGSRIISDFKFSFESTTLWFYQFKEAKWGYRASFRDRQ